MPPRSAPVRLARSVLAMGIMRVIRLEMWFKGKLKKSMVLEQGFAHRVITRFSDNINQPSFPASAHDVRIVVKELSE